MLQQVVIFFSEIEAHMKKHLLWTFLIYCMVGVAIYTAETNISTLKLLQDNEAAYRHFISLTLAPCIAAMGH